jgi:hypothetical protein
VESDGSAKRTTDTNYHVRVLVCVGLCWCVRETNSGGAEGLNFGADWIIGAEVYSVFLIGAFLLARFSYVFESLWEIKRQTKHARLKLGRVQALRSRWTCCQSRQTWKVGAPYRSQPTLQCRAPGIQETKSESE